MPIWGEIWEGKAYDDYEIQTMVTEITRYLMTLQGNPADPPWTITARASE